MKIKRTYKFSQETIDKIDHLSKVKKCNRTRVIENLVDGEYDSIVQPRAEYCKKHEMYKYCVYWVNESKCSPNCPHHSIKVV